MTLVAGALSLPLPCPLTKLEKKKNSGNGGVQRTFPLSRIPHVCYEVQLPQNPTPLWVLPDTRSQSKAGLNQQTELLLPGIPVEQTGSGPILTTPHTSPHSDTHRSVTQDKWLLLKYISKIVSVTVI